MKIHDIMTSGARCVSPGDSLAQAARVMRELDVGAVPVCNNDHLDGMLTDRDIAIRAVADGRDPQKTTVKETMSPHIIYAFEDDEVDRAAHLMEEHQIRRLPVLNREKRLVGIVSLGDISTRASADLSGEALKEVSRPESAAHK